MAESGVSSENSGLFSSIFFEMITSPVNIALLSVFTFLVYNIVKVRRKILESVPLELPKLRRDFTVEELKKYDGTAPDGRILAAVNGSVFDVTRSRRLYGPGGPYMAFGGNDVSRAFATFSSQSMKDEYDGLSDTFEMFFRNKYDYVGRLLKPGEEPTNYSD
jgi:membrane-associated progesterone receptor component